MGRQDKSRKPIPDRACSRQAREFRNSKLKIENRQFDERRIVGKIFILVVIIFALASCRGVFEHIREAQNRDKEKKEPKDLKE